MKKRLLLLTVLVVALIAVFAISASAADWTYKDEAGETYLTLTIDDETGIVTEYNGKFPMWTENNEPLTWYVIKTEGNVKTVKSFISTDPVYTNHGNGYFRFIQEANFTLKDQYPVPTKENVVSMNMPNDMGITAFSNYSAVNFQAGVDYTPNKFEILFLRCPNTLTNTERLVQATKILEVEFDKASTFTELSHLSFHNCKSLRKVNIPASVEKILSQSDNNGRAFYNCVSLDQLTFDEGSNLNEIQNGAFKGAKLKEIQLPASMTTINNNVFSYTIGLEIVRFPETFTHFVNINSNGTIRNDHHSFTYTPDNPTSVKEYYLPATFYATKPEVSYQSSYAFYSGGNVKFFYCGTLEQFNTARENFRDGTTKSYDNNGNFLNATTVSYEDYLNAIALDPSAYSDADYVIYGYNSCDAFHKGEHDLGEINSCMDSASCDRECGFSVAPDFEGHSIAKTLVYANGFDKAGEYNCICENADYCTAIEGYAVEESTNPIITFKGYSVPELASYFGINAGYKIDTDLLTLYESLSDEKVTVGLLMVNADDVGIVADLIDADAELVANVRGFSVTMVSLNYEDISIEIKGFDKSTTEGNYYKLSLVSAIFVKTGDDIEYLQDAIGDETVATQVQTTSGTVFNTITADRVYLSKQ